MTLYELKQMLENTDKPNLIIKEGAKGFIACFRLSPERVGIGKTEIAALDNLKELISAQQKTINSGSGKELKARHRKLWNY